MVPANPASIGTYFSLLNKEIEFTKPVVFDLSNVTASITGRLISNADLFFILFIRKEQNTIKMHGRLSMHTDGPPHRAV